MKLNLDTAIGMTGRFRVMTHTGHTYDADGNVVEEGDVIEETQFGNNLILDGGLAALLGANDLTCCPVVGSGNAPPLPTDTTLQAYRGRANVFTAPVTYTYSDTPDANGMLWMRWVFRVTFNPGSLGSGAVIINEAGIAMGSPSNVNAATKLFSRGLIVDATSNPTGVALDAANEYLDLFWEYTRYFPAEVTGTIIGFDIKGTPTDISYVVRPSNWRQQASTSNYEWSGCAMGVNGITLSGVTRTSNNNLTQSVRSGPLGTHLQYPSGTGSTNTSQVVATPGAKTYSWTAKWNTTNGNISGGVGAVLVDCRSCTWQVSYNPKLPKTSDDELSLDFTVTIGNYAP